MSELTLVRYRLALAKARWADLTHGAGTPLAADTLDRMESADLAAVHAAGALSPWTRNAVFLAVIGAAAWLVAAAGDGLGVPGGWTILLAVLATIGATYVLDRVLTAAAVRAGRRRTRAHPDLPPIVAPPQVSPVAAILALLRLARTDLATAGRPSAVRRYWRRRVDRRLCQIMWLVEGWPTTDDA
ncbi:hypothetical protein [Dactylosporangium sp. NPDC051541]|uniref:hypothetical protein n=1 Tax=Dactylosporangium sp. NPDC051541 TaxID=3363977 RepID=UPI0037BD56B3